MVDTKPETATVSADCDSRERRELVVEWFVTRVECTWLVGEI
jgi:hypothetical protein